MRSRATELKVEFIETFGEFALAGGAAQRRQAVPAVDQLLFERPVVAHPGHDHQAKPDQENGRGQPQGGAGGAENEDDKRGYGIVHGLAFRGAKSPQAWMSVLARAVP